MSSSVDAFLAHFGVKGMKWGIVRTDDQLARASGSSKETTKTSGGGSSEISTKDMSKALDDFYKDKTPEQLQAEGKRKLAAQAAKVYPHKKSADPSDDEDVDPKASDLKSGGLTTKQKIALGVGAAAVVGVMAYYGNQAYQENKKALALGEARKEARRESSRRHDSEWESVFGTKPTPRTDPLGPGEGFFYTGLQSKKALDRPGFTIPKTTMFQRLSNHHETGTGYDEGTYATFLTNDKKKYGASSEFGSKKYTLEFQPMEDVRVPSTKTVLGELKKMRQENGSSYDDAAVVKEYHNMSGSSWSSKEQKQLIERLKKRGYSAIVDDMDAGYLGDLPVVFFGKTANVMASQRSISDRQRDENTSIPLTRQYA